MCDLKDAHEKGYMTKPIHYNSIYNYLENAAFTPVLRDMITHSSLPLRTVKTAFAPDSSGFSTSRFVRWFDEKYGITRSGHDWVKVHLMTGVKTNIVAAVEIHHRDAADCPQFEPLVKATAANFTVKEVSADKAYLSHDNLSLVVGLGATPYIPFKSNSQPGEANSLWEKLFLFYSFHREDFLTRYHQRSNVESTFRMIKGRFGGSVRSKTDVAMTNEVLCKVLCHNLCVVIQSQIELGIAPVFWPKNAEQENPDVLPMVQPG